MEAADAGAREHADRTGHRGGGRGATAPGWMWIAGSLLASAALVLLASLPALPTTLDAITGWVERGRFQLTWAGELLFFAVITWGAGAVGTLTTHEAGSALRRSIAAIALAVALVAFVVVLLALGRLVYPVVDLDPGPDTVLLLASVVLGSVHLAMLSLGVVAMALPASARSPRAARASIATGVVVGTLFIVGSFPWLLPMWLDIATAGLVGCWGVLLGVAHLRQLRRRRREGRPAPPHRMAP